MFLTMLRTAATYYFYSKFYLLAFVAAIQLLGQTSHRKLRTSDVANNEFLEPIPNLANKPSTQAVDSE